MADKPVKPEEEREEEVEIEKEEEKEEKTIEVSTEEKKQEPKVVTAEEFEKERKRSEFLNRKLDKTLKRIDEMTQKFQGVNVQPQKTVPEVEQDISKLTNEQIDTIAQNDWQKAVDIKAELSARKVFEEKEAKVKQQEEQTKITSQLETSKKKVRARYSDIDDENSDNAQLYMKVLNEDPSLLSNVHGPELAMHRMEDMMRDQGKTPLPIREEVNKQVESEIQRRERTGAGGLQAGRSPSNNDKVSLTQSEVDFADNAGIPRSEFAKMKKLSPREFKDGVSVDE